MTTTLDVRLDASFSELARVVSALHRIGAAPTRVTYDVLSGSRAVIELDLMDEGARRAADMINRLPLVTSVTVAEPARNASYVRAALARAYR